MSCIRARPDRENAFARASGGGSQPGTQLSPVSEAAIARPSELLRDVFVADRKGVVTQLSSLRRRDRADQGMAKGLVASPARVQGRPSSGIGVFGLP